MVRMVPQVDETRPAARFARLRFTAVVLAALLAGSVAAASAHAAALVRLSGRVIDSETQAPISNVDVELSNQSGGQGYFRSRTNARGEFAMQRIPSDRWYTLTVGAEGYADFVLGGWQFPAAQRAVELLVPLDKAGAVEVRATKSDGRTPVPGARVSLIEERGDSWWEGWRPPPAPRFTDDKGSTRFEGLRAGTYTVTADVAGLRPAEARNVQVRRGETRTLPLPMTRPASLAGTVKLADGGPVSGIAVTARGPAEGVGTTDADGAFAIGDLPPGRFRLDVSSDGFDSFVSRETYALGEGDSREGVSLVVTPKPPEFAFVIDREAFLPEATVRVGLRSFRVDGVDLAVFRIPPERLLDDTRDVRRNAATGDTTGLARLTTWRHVVGAGPEWTWREGELLIPEPLSPGAYVLRGTGGGLVRAIPFFVTDLGLLVKRSSSQVFTSVASLRSGQPVEDARIYAIPIAMTPLKDAKGWAEALAVRRGQPPIRSDARGIATIATPNGVPATMGGRVAGPVRLRIVAVSEAHGVAVADAPLAAAAEQGGDALFLYTDRPIYRPGHTINWKAFARRSRGPEYALPPPAPVSLTLSGPDGATLDVKAATLSAHGSADGSITLPNELALGDWTLSARAGAAAGSATVGVQQYRKPEYRVDVEPDRAVYVNGDEVRFRIAANYFFGAPVFGATVRYNLFESRIGDDWDRDFDEGGPTGYGRVLKTGETRTDLDGRADVIVTPDRAGYDRKLTLEVEVIDASNRTVSGRGTTIVGRGLFTLSVRPRSWVVAAGAAVPIEVLTRDHTGAPVSAAVTIELDQQAWNPITHRYTRSTRPLATTTVTTDRTGRAVVNLTPSPARPGQIMVHARAEDARRNRITADASVWAWDEDVTDYAYRYPALEVMADRDRYAPGDTVRVLINSEVKNAPAIATLEGRDLYDTRIVTLNGGTGLATFVLKPEYAPNAFVSVHVRKGREVHSRALELSVDANRHDLKITLTPDREQYGPGDSAHVAVETHDGAGAPVAAELSLGVVGEAIYSLRADATPDPHDVFYGKRPNWVTTSIAFPSLLLGGADKSGREEPRRDFRDVALWAPIVTTGADGRARVGLKYPDNLTTWRMTSRGLTDATLVGRTVAKTLVTKDIVARLAGPRFFIAGDQASLVSVVNNRTAAPLTGGETTLEAKGVTLAGPAKAAFSAPARGEARATWAIRVPAEAPADSAQATLTLRARTKTDSDALEISILLRPRAVTVRSSGGGVASAPGRTLPVPLPNDLLRAGSAVTIDVSPSALGMALAGADGLMLYPYGCTEQTANAILAGTALVRAVKPAPQPPPGWSAPADRLAPYLRRLASMQLDEGGWGWWKPGEFDPYLSALALDALAQATRLELAPAEARQALANGASRLPRTFAETRDLDGEAYLLAHLVALPGIPAVDERLSDLKSRLGSLADNLYANRKDLGNAGLALAAQGFAGIGRATQAAELVSLLMSRAIKDSHGLHWTADPHRASAWYGEDLDATGHALAAMARVTPKDARAAEVVRWLAARRTGLGWRTTLTTAPITVGLAAYSATRAAEAAPAGRMRIDWNGETLLDRTLQPADVYASNPLRVVVPGSRLKPGDNRLALTVSGGAPAYVAWEARARVPSPGPDTRKETRLRVTREFLRVERTADRRGRPQYLSSPLEPGTPPRVGEQIMVRLTLTAPEALDHLLIVDPRAAGFEVDALLPEGVDRPYGTNGEEHDDHVAFFVDHLEPGDTAIEYLVRPELAGTFTALPPEAGGMYEPELLVRGAEAKVTVVEGVK